MRKRAPQRRKTPELIDDFLMQISLGKNIKEICRQENMPHFSTIFDWLQQDAEFRERYMTALANKAMIVDAQIDETLDSIRHYADLVNQNKLKKDAAIVGVHQARLEIDTLKWKAAKYYPRMFGADTQRVEVEHKAGSFLDDLKLVAERVEEKRKQLKAVDAEYEIVKGDEVVKSEGENHSTALPTFSREIENENENHSQEEGRKQDRK